LLWVIMWQSKSLILLTLFYKTNAPITYLLF